MINVIINHYFCLCQPLLIVSFNLLRVKLQLYAKKKDYLIKN